MNKKIMLISIGIIIVIYSLIVFFNSETYNRIYINSKLKQLDSDDIREVKRAQSFFVKKGKKSIPILKNVLNQTNSKFKKEVALCLIGVISSSEYYAILCEQVHCSKEDRLPIIDSYNALEKLTQKQLKYLYDSYTKLLNSEKNKGIKNLVYAIKEVVKEKGWDLENCKGTASSK